MNALYKMVFVPRLVHNYRFFTENIRNYLPREPSWSLAELNIATDRKDYSSNRTVMSPNLLKDLAELAHLEISPSQAESILQEVESIIQCTNILHTSIENKDIDEVIYSTNAPLEAKRSPLRKDIITDGAYADDLLNSASQRSGYFFSVPKVVDE